LSDVDNSVTESVFFYYWLFIFLNNATLYFIKFARVPVISLYLQREMLQ